MKDDSVDTPLKDQWYDQHPVVSTVLWLIGGITKTPELPLSPTDKIDSSKIPRTNSRLSWKDEHDGEIAEYISHDAKEKNSVSLMSRKKSMSQVSSPDSLSEEGAALRRHSTDDDDDSDDQQRPSKGGGGGGSGDTDQDDSPMSPQWGWYVSTTPPQELYGKESTKTPPHPPPHPPPN